MALRKTALAVLAAAAALVAAPLTGVFTSSASARSARTEILPPDNPQFSLAVLEYIWPECSSAHDYSTACMEPSLAMLNAGRLNEHLGPVVLPSNWQQLTVAEQLFVLTELERTARGLPADTGLAADWDAAAQTGADAGRDPTQGGSGAGGFLAVWAGGQPNPIVVMADWIYADGKYPDGASQNLGCSASSKSGCWSHRDIVLHDSASTACHSHCAIGAAFSASGYSSGVAGKRESYAEIFGVDNGKGSDALNFTWAAEQQQLPDCEQSGDSCSWAGIKVATASGIRDASGGTSVSSKTGGDGATVPAFAVHFLSQVSRDGLVSLRIRTGVRLLGITVVGRSGDHRVRFRVRRRSEFVFGATAKLTPGRWMLTIRYHQRGRAVRPISKRRLTVH